MVLIINKFESHLEVVMVLRLKGYVENLNLKSNCLKCLAHEMVLWPKDFQVDEIYYFKSKAPKRDNSIYYGVTGKNRIKGMLHVYCDFSLEILSSEMKSKLCIF